MAKHKQTFSNIRMLLERDAIRRIEQDGQTYYAAADLVGALVESERPEEYWRDLKQREPKLSTICEQLEAVGPDGVPEVTDMVDLAGALRLIQSIPTPRAERIKQWLAQSAVQRLNEEENPELAVLRSRKLYQDQGYSKRWIDKRLRGVAARHELTGEWFKRGVSDSEEFRTLTNELFNGAFGMDVASYRRYKNLSRPGDNLRDHMSDLELILTMLGETAAAALHRDRSSQGFEELVKDVRDAGEIAARTRLEIEARSTRPVVNPWNFYEAVPVKRAFSSRRLSCS